MKQHNQAIFKRHDGFQSLLPMFEEVAHPLFENNVEEGGRGRSMNLSANVAEDFNR